MIDYPLCRFAVETGGFLVLHPSGLRFQLKGGMVYVIHKIGVPQRVYYWCMLRINSRMTHSPQGRAEPEILAGARPQALRGPA